MAGAKDVGGGWVCSPANDTVVQIWNNLNPGKLTDDAGANNYTKVQRVDGGLHDGLLWATG